jgi:hypothetical protein
MAMIDTGQVAERLAIVRDRIARAGGTDVHVMGVTKTWGIDAVRAAAAVGCDSVGENYAQDLAANGADGFAIGIILLPGAEPFGVHSVPGRAVDLVPNDLHAPAVKPDAVKEPCNPARTR